MPQSLAIPTAAEFRLLDILWHLGEGTIDELLRASENNRLNYKTVQTILRIMESKRLVSHSLRGRAFVFRPRVKRSDVSRLSIRSFLNRYFGGSRSELLVNLLENERIDLDELQALERLIRNHRKARIAARQKPR